MAPKAYDAPGLYRAAKLALRRAARARHEHLGRVAVWLDELAADLRDMASRETTEDLSVQRCWKCSMPAQQEAKFCGQCGAPLVR